MEITIDGLGKRFVGHWVFKDLSVHIPSGQRLAIAGPNGSGKSTLLQIVAGAIPPSAGSIAFHLPSGKVEPSELFHHLTLSTPYMELIGEMTVEELLTFHTRYRTLARGMDHSDFKAMLQLTYQPGQRIKTMSSGMRQRLKLGLAMATESACVLLDEPTSNLDTQAKSWYYDILAQLGTQRTMLIASNDEADFVDCHGRVELMEYKVSRRVYHATD